MLCTHVEALECLQGVTAYVLFVFKTVLVLTGACSSFVDECFGLGVGHGVDEWKEK